MRRYEMMTVFDADLESEGLEALSKKIESLINKHQGKVSKVDQMGKRRLSYEINHKREGHYNVYFFEGDSATIKELERVLRITDDVIRFGIYRLPEKM